MGDSYLMRFCVFVQIFTEKDFHYLEITDVTTDDRGQYTCVIANTMGTTRVTAELEVYRKYSRPNPRDPPHSTHVLM